MSGTDIRVVDLPDLGAVTDVSLFIADKNVGTGHFTGLALKNYVAITTLPEAPSNNTPYGRMNGAWSPVLGDAPSNSIPYARMNAAWSPVVPEAPLTGSTYGRMNGTWNPALPMTGGTVNGNVGATNFTAANAVYTNDLLMSAANGYAWSFFVDASGNQIQNHSPSWYEIWNAGSGARGWYAPSGQLMLLDGGGDLFVTGYVNAPAFWSNLIAAGGFGFGAGGSGRIFSFNPNFYLDYAPSGATLQYVVSNGPLWVMRPADDFCFNNQAAVGGHGAYTDISDRRVKNDLAPATQGLDVILRLQPVTFTRKSMSKTPRPNATPKREIGFVAQDLAAVLPEAVRVAGVELPDGTGGLESVEPTLGMTASTITAVSVNAIKELHAMVVTLVARVAAIEGSPA